jgi:hypothetical protein
VKVRFLESLNSIDLRFTLIDKNFLIFGFLKNTSNIEEPSKEGIDIKGHKISALLSDFYINQWEQAIEYEIYVKRIIENCIQDRTNSVEMIAQQLNIPIDEIKRIIAK